MRRNGRTITVEVASVDGSFEGMLRTRGYVVRLRSTWPPTRVTWNGTEVPYDPHSAVGSWAYDGDELTTIVTLPREDVSRPKTLVVEQPSTVDDALLDGVPGQLQRLYTAMTMLETLWSADWPSDAFVTLQQTGRRITLHPDSAQVELRRFHAHLPAVLRQVPNMKGDTLVIRNALRHLEVGGG
jgi:hypothetical protein